MSKTNNDNKTQMIENGIDNWNSYFYRRKYGYRMSYDGVSRKRNY